MDLFENWLPNLLTPQELRGLQKRFRILQLLKTKLNYREIARKMKISTTTVVRLNQRLNIRDNKGIDRRKSKGISKKPSKGIRNQKNQKNKNYTKSSAIADRIVYKEKRWPWKFG